jgi:hypothetical protein
MDIHPFTQIMMNYQEKMKETSSRFDKLNALIDNASVNDFPCLEVDNERELKLRVKLCFEKLVNETLYQNDEEKNFCLQSRRLRDSTNLLASNNYINGKVQNGDLSKIDAFRRSSNGNFDSSSSLVRGSSTFRRISVEKLSNKLDTDKRL